MEIIKFNIYDNTEVIIEIDNQKKDLILKEIIEWMKLHNCSSGEMLHQNDNCIIYSPTLISDIIDDILEPTVNWNE